MLKKKFKSIDKLSLLFKQLDIKKNDNVILHSNIAGLYQFENSNNKNYINYFKKFIVKYIGSKGTLLIPTYNYDFINGGSFNQKESKSQVGLFGDYLLRKYYKSRTISPIFSHLVFGKLKKQIFDSDTKEVFGKKSVFAIIKKKKFKIVCFCCSPKAITFIHFIEKTLKVNYRSNKVFSGYLNKKKTNVKYYAGKKNIDYSLKENKILKLINNKEFRECDYGRFKCYSVNSDFLFKELKKKIKIKQNYLIKN